MSTKKKSSKEYLSDIRIEKEQKKDKLDQRISTRTIMCIWVKEP